MRVKIIHSSFAEHIEDNINEWLKEYPGYDVVSITHYSNILNEKYHSDANQIANQWTEYITTIMYKE